MKNRSIYWIVGGMLIALVGIIWIQATWVLKAVDQQEKAFGLHVSDAMNLVNEAVDERESIFVFEEKYGDVDSLVNEVIVRSGVVPPRPPRPPKSRVLEHRVHGKSSGGAAVASEDEDVHISVGSGQAGVTINVDRKQENWISHNEVIVIEDSNSEWERTKEKLENIEQDKIRRAHRTMRRYSIERLLGADLKERLPFDELKKQTRQALRKEGIREPFELAVFNSEKQTYEKGYMTRGFKPEQENLTYLKKMFPSDRGLFEKYELVLQFDKIDGTHMRPIQRMAGLGTLFTLLIVLSFGLSIHFIYKQKKISKIKNDFINNMTHELKTPLASISLATSSINHDEVINKPEEIKRYTSLIAEEQKRMNQHVERVLEIAALQKGDVNFHCETQDLNQIISDAHKRIHMHLQEAKATYTFDSSVNDALIHGDKHHLTNVFTNLIDNSLKYRSEARTLEIHVALKLEKDQFQISIRDNGIGMSKKEQRLAFDRFYRANMGDVHNQKGFGLGLSYVKSTIEAHRGKVEINSESHKGTTIKICIPKLQTNE